MKYHFPPFFIAVTTEVKNAVQERRNNLMAHQIKRQKSQETWDTKVRFPNLNSEQKIKKPGSTLGHTDHGIEGFRREKSSPTAEQEEDRLRRQATAKHDNKAGSSLPQTLSAGKIKTVQRSSSPIGTFTPREGMPHGRPGGETPRLALRTAESMPASAQAEPRSITETAISRTMLRRSSLALVSTQISSTLEDALEKQDTANENTSPMSLQDIYLINIRAKNSIINMYAERNGSFLSLAAQPEKQGDKKAAEKDSKMDGQEDVAPMQQLSGEGIEQTSAYSIEKPLPRFSNDLLDSSGMHLEPMVGAPPPEPGSKSKSFLNRVSGSSLGGGILGKKRAEAFINSTKRASEIDYSDTESEESDEFSDTSGVVQNAPFGSSKVPFGGGISRGASLKAPFFSEVEPSSDEPADKISGQNIYDKSNHPSQSGRPMTAPEGRKKITKKSNLARIDDIIANINSAERNSRSNSNCSVTERLRKSLDDAKSVSSEKSNDILFFNNDKEVVK